MKAWADWLIARPSSQIYNYAVETIVQINPATRPRPLVWDAGQFPRGTYVVATKYSDGDPGDHWCVGFYYGAYMHCIVSDQRHIVVNSDGVTFRHNGFRRVERIGSKRGEWIVQHIPLIQRYMDRFSVWHWAHAAWAELDEWAFAEASVE